MFLIHLLEKNLLQPSVFHTVNMKTDLQMRGKSMIFGKEGGGCGLRLEGQNTNVQYHCRL